MLYTLLLIEHANDHPLLLFKPPFSPVLFSLFFRVGFPLYKISSSLNGRALVVMKNWINFFGVGATQRVGTLGR
jgi:hypothetical protein